MRKKVLVVASTSDHLKNFHIPYIENLKKNYDVKIMAKDKEGDHFANYNINFEKKIFSFNNIKIVHQIKKILENEKFDVVFVNTTLAAFLVRMAIKKLKEKPYVVNIVHGYLFGERSCFIRKTGFLFAEKITKSVTDNIVVMNEEDEDIAKRHKLCKGEIIKIKGMGIDGSRFKEIKPKKKFNTGNDYEVSFVGELTDRKNQKFLIKFIKEIVKFDISIKLNLIGDGVLKKKLEKLAKKKKVADRVNFLGYDNDIQKYISGSDYYISASKIEGLPFNILESMYLGAVVFASDTKGNVDLIDDLENGVLYKLGDTKDLIAKFRLVKNNKELQEKIRKNAKETSKKYLLNAVFDENMQIFENFIR